MILEKHWSILFAASGEVDLRRTRGDPMRVDRTMKTLMFA